MFHKLRTLAVILSFGGVLVSALSTSALAKEPGSAASMPQVGETATDFELKDVNGKAVELSTMMNQSPVVLVVLRGFPGYQCPLCTRQVGELIGAKDKIDAAGAKVIMVYPGPSVNLDEKAKEFLKNSTLPENYTLLLDPGYKFTNAYHLRWDAPRETAYPSTFLIDKGGKIAYAKISKEHGDRSSVDTVVAELQKLK